MSAASEDELKLLHNLVAKMLAEKLSSGEASASDFSNAIKMLKDNCITCAPSQGNAMGELAGELKKASSPSISPTDRKDLAAALENVSWIHGRSN
jgi:hypothetical protein